MEHGEAQRRGQAAGGVMGLDDSKRSVLCPAARCIRWFCPAIYRSTAGQPPGLGSGNVKGTRQTRLKCTQSRSQWGKLINNGAVTTEQVSAIRGEVPEPRGA